MRVYLAGPDVFFKDAKKQAEELKALCSEHGLTGVFPLDAEITPHLMGPITARRIFDANVELIRSCKGVLANVTPFRGPSADVGTAWEMGFAHALGLPVAAYTTDGRAYATRVTPDAYDVEDFGLAENLMLACGAHISMSRIAAVKRLAGVLLKQPGHVAF